MDETSTMESSPETNAVAGNMGFLMMARLPSNSIDLVRLVKKRRRNKKADGSSVSNMNGDAASTVTTGAD